MINDAVDMTCEIVSSEIVNNRNYVLSFCIENHASMFILMNAELDHAQEEIDTSSLWLNN